ncbi:MAG: RsbRD N-terminal domain-containing protein [Deltaproteobacteria bacterium]|nr:RsbRD N-terminal domain-containing protein [Deltaproteobacteria bacterium]MBW1922629.1 RsbRD N-terminal domain-containing protein [Deltaproteobacteria bacterium]MBW1949404.1 RsbRD N-terminal domain-containing protein [Deltaproteobacteria bacterium]MBW2008174.1 RsbRD N-terminal domain-containing protein [Deltaproteobacteria bacterium]MBW2102710.1 RsbRD N-terminal domain-containing protein [Deltaproteobacteria bacterium]
MDLQRQLEEKKSSILKKWLEFIIGSYPRESRRFLTKEKDRFSNPVGQVIAERTEALYDGLISGGDEQVIVPCLEDILRIRAVQDLKPSQAVGFVLQLKQVVRQVLQKGVDGAVPSAALREFENRVDETALLAFDVYTRHKQKIYNIRVDEVKRQVTRLLKRANLVYEIPEMGPDL